MSLLSLLTLFRRLDRLFELENKHGKLIEEHSLQIQALRDEIAQLRAREAILVAEARGAAGSVASVVAAQHISDMSRRLGAMEERTRSKAIAARD